MITATVKQHQSCGQTEATRRTHTEVDLLCGIARKQKGEERQQVHEDVREVDVVKERVRPSLQLKPEGDIGEDRVIDAMPSRLALH